MSQDPIKQADFFVQTIANKGGFNGGADLAPMVDVEVTDGVFRRDSREQPRKFITEAQSKLGGGVALVIYTGPSFWISTLGNPDLSQNPLSDCALHDGEAPDRAVALVELHDLAIYRQGADLGHQRERRRWRQVERFAERGAVVRDERSRGFRESRGVRRPPSFGGTRRGARPLPGPRPEHQ